MRRHGVALLLQSGGLAVPLLRRAHLRQRAERVVVVGEEIERLLQRLFSGGGRWRTSSRWPIWVSTQARSSVSWYGMR